MGDIKLYGEETSDDAKQLIIGLFNKLNKGEPYSMKTITTIYKNDEIFKDDLRYPIDAPYQNFYKELTEYYVAKYDLDSIFFEKGVAKEGEYYFEYSYNKSQNSFDVYQSPVMDLEIKKRYVPMLYSMVTGREIDWEEAKVDFVSVKDASENYERRNRILIVFGKDRLKTLEFSWLATFELATDELDYFKKKITDQKSEIIHFTQGVLFSRLDEIILGFERIKELVKNLKHTVKNFGFDDHIMLLQSKLESGEIDEALTMFDYMYSLAKIRDISTEIITMYDSTADKFVLGKEYNTYTAILTLLMDSLIDKSKGRLQISPEIHGNTLNQIEVDDLVDVFTLLINLYSNSRGKKLRQHEIDFFVLNGKLTIRFINAEEMGIEFIRYLNGETTINPSKGDGLRFIVQSLSKLPHLHLNCFLEEGKTITLLTINPK